MKSLLKSFAKRLLFKSEHAKTFPAVRISSDQIIEKVYLKNETEKIDISERHGIVCHAPFCIAVWMAPDQADGDFQKVTIETNQFISAEADLSFTQRIEEGNNRILVFKIVRGVCHQIHPFRQLLIARYFRNKNTPAEDKIYGALYSYPRRVIAVSFKDESHYNIFPMDFQCYIVERKLYILGLRTTNITLEKILLTKKLVIGDTDAAPLEIIYGLGSHHSTAAPDINTLPFAITNSERFKFPVADFSASYRELDIIESYKLGTHTMFIGKVSNEQVIRTPTSSLYHIHFFQSLQSYYPQAI